ncbi:MAG TPA: hypothetical protein VFS43_23550 [Polyangiaceae bacterium]|nr:hypothetical protein [Polyangiaceae bacterium]
MSSLRFWSILGVSSALLLVGACSDDDDDSPARAGAAGAAPGAGGAGGEAGRPAGASGEAGRPAGAGGAAGPAYTFKKVDGFRAPESCYWDEERQVWYVSNIDATSADLTQPDGSGWISRLDPEGNVLEPKWVEGLDTPAGLRLLNGRLYVANIDEVVGIDVATATVAERVAAPGATLLNDPDTDGEYVYVTDTFGNKIYRFRPGGAAEVFLESPDLRGPNGLLVDGGGLFVASVVDFTSPAQAPFLRVDLATKRIEPFGSASGKFDGIEKDGATYLLSDNPTGRILRVAADGSFEVEYDLKADQGLQAINDIGFAPSRNVLCVPDLTGNSVSFLAKK